MSSMMRRRGITRDREKQTRMKKKKRMTKKVKMRRRAKKMRMVRMKKKKRNRCISLQKSCLSVQLVDFV